MPVSGGGGGHEVWGRNDTRERRKSSLETVPTKKTFGPYKVI